MNMYFYITILQLSDTEILLLFTRMLLRLTDKGVKLAFIFLSYHALTGLLFIALQQLCLTFAYCTAGWRDCTFKWVKITPDDKGLAD